MEDLRVERGRQIAISRKLRPGLDGSWIVLSQTLPKTKYVVHPDPAEPTCTCPDYGAWELPCKHIYAVRFFQTPRQVELDEAPEIMRPSYPQDWAAYNAAQVNEQEHFQVLLRDLCAGIAQPEQRTGRPRLPLSDAVYAVVAKVYSTMSGRRASGDIRLCKERGFIDVTPHYNSISAYLAKAELTPILTALIEQTAAPLKAVERDFAVDATGFSTSVYSRWFDHKWGKEKKSALWLKAHAMVGVKTNVVTAIQVTEGNMHDSPMFAGLVEATAKTFAVNEVSADKAYISRRNLKSVADAGGMAYIPFKSNNKGVGPVHWERLWHLFWFKRDEFARHYHKRSNVEATFSALKRKFGGNVRSKGPVAQQNEVLAKVLAYNITVVILAMHELGVQPEFFGNGAAS